MSYEFVIHKTVPVVCEDKQGNAYYGDVPCVRLNHITGQYEEVVNPRGNAYGARNRLKHRNKK